MSLKNSGGNGYMTTFDLSKSQHAGIALSAVRNLIGTVLQVINITLNVS
jgi:hypothetical protein